MKSHKDAALRAFLKGRSRRAEGDLFRWLWANHDAVLEGVEVHHVGWSTIVERLEAAGVTGKRGGRPTHSAVVKVWGRVKREKLREAQAPAGVVRKRTPPNRSPRAASRPPTSSANGVGDVPPVPASIERKDTSPFARASSTHSGSDRRTPTPAEMIENVKRQLAGKWGPEKPGGS